MKRMILNMASELAGMSSNFPGGVAARAEAIDEFNDFTEVAANRLCAKKFITK